jgi:hypothetical protein
VDNAALRADGIGGLASQGSDIIIEDASTTTANNVQIRNNHVGQTNSALVLTAKGTGALIFGNRPGDTTSGAQGGDARGSSAIDLQRDRTASTQVASGTASFCQGARNTASGNYARSSGFASTASGENATATGNVCTASAAYSEASGNRATADRVGLRARTGAVFAAGGDCQIIEFNLSGKTTTNSAVELTLDGIDIGTGGIACTIPLNKVVSGILQVSGVLSTGAKSANYVRQIHIKNVGGTITLLQSITIGTDYTDGTSLSVTGSTSGTKLVVAVTGNAAETWRWCAVFHGIEHNRGT